MKKVTIYMVIIVVIFCLSTCGFLVYRQQNPSAIALDRSSAQQTERFSSIHINSEGKLNINTATAAELSVLTGIGEILAGRIIQYREDNGPYKTVDELLNVNGIGEGKLNKIFDYIYAG